MESRWATASVIGEFATVYLGTDKGKGIYSARWDNGLGTMSDLKLAIAAEHPTFLVLHPQLPVLYAALEGSGAAAAVASYRMQRGGGLTEINRVSSGGDSPCFLSVDALGKALFAANYGGGSVAAFHLAGDGRLSEAAGVLHCRTSPVCGPPGPVKDRQDGSHPHCAVVAPGNACLIECDLGTDALMVFPVAVDAADPLGKPIRVAARPGSGPRHVAFHPNGRWMYCIHELDCTIDLWDWDAGAKAPLRMRAGGVVSTLERGVPLTGNTAAEVRVSEDGRFVYSCTRGVNTVEVYRADPSTGLLQEIQRVSCGGTVPRMIVLQGDWLLSCNQASEWVTVFRRDRATGRVEEKPRVIAAETPMCAVFGSESR